MLKTSTFMILGAFVLAGCATPQSRARDADEAQHEANEKAAQAIEDTKLEADEIRRRAEEENARNARNAVTKGQEAQGEANEKMAEATASLAQARVEARDENEKKLAGLENEVAELKPRLVGRLSQAEFAALVRDFTARSEAVRRSIGDLASATVDSLEPVKRTIAQRLADFGQAIHEAKKRV